MEKYPVVCKEHGVWDVSLDNHINKKSGCPRCIGQKVGYLDKIKQANIVHNNKYDYSLITKDFKSHNSIKLPIKCKKHGVFEMLWTNHIHQQQGCPKCNPCGRKKITKDQMKQRILELKHNYKYNWKSLKGYYDYIEIKCKKHGWFFQQVSNHLFGQQCPKCKRSGGEELIEKILKQKNINYETQKKFDDCINPDTGYKLKYDFYINNLNLCIEFDGELHFKPVKFFGGEKSFIHSQKLDKIKNEFCKNNNISLLRISYMDFKNIENILNKII